MHIHLQDLINLLTTNPTSGSHNSNVQLQQALRIVIIGTADDETLLNHRVRSYFQHVITVPKRLTPRARREVIRSIAADLLPAAAAAASGSESVDASVQQRCQLVNQRIPQTQGVLPLILDSYYLLTASPLHAPPLAAEAKLDEPIMTDVFGLQHVKEVRLFRGCYISTPWCHLL